MMNLQLRVNHLSCRLGNSSGLLCVWFKSVVCVQFFDKQAGLTLRRQLRAQLTSSRQLCRSLFFSHKKKPLPAITARAKGNFKYFSLDFLFWTSHTLRVLTASRHVRIKIVITILTCNKLQLKLKIIHVINQNTKHVQPDFIYILKSLCIFPHALTKRHRCHIKSWAYSLESLIEVFLYYTGPAEQLHLLKLLRRLKSFKDNQNLHCRIISFAYFQKQECFHQLL